MEQFNSLLDLSIKVPTAVTIGKFDGIHKGHHLLTSDIISKKSSGLSSCLITFKNSPRFSLSKDVTPSLFTNKEKEYILVNKIWLDEFKYIFSYDEIEKILEDNQKIYTKYFFPFIVKIFAATSNLI